MAPDTGELFARLLPLLMGFSLLRFAYHAAFLEEADRIFEDWLMPIIQKRLRVIAFFNLGKPFLTLFLHAANRFRNLEFQNHRSASEFQFGHHDVGSSVSTLTIGFHAVAADVHKKPRHKSVVEILGILIL